jgi:hypothetical protein
MHIAVSYRCRKVNIYLKGFFLFCIADMRLSQCLIIIDVNSVLGLLRCVGVGSVSDILEVHAQTHNSLYTLALKMEPGTLPTPTHCNKLRAEFTFYYVVNVYQNEGKSYQLCAVWYLV